MNTKHFRLTYLGGVYAIAETWVISDHNLSESEVLKIIKRQERGASTATFIEERSNAVSSYYSIATTLLGFNDSYVIRVTEEHPLYMNSSAPVG